MISDIKKALDRKKDNNIVIFVDVGRNKMEKYEGKVINTYKYIWTFKTKTGLKCFSYSDVLSKIVIIDSLYE